MVSGESKRRTLDIGVIHAAYNLPHLPIIGAAAKMLLTMLMSFWYDDKWAYVDGRHSRFLAQY